LHALFVLTVYFLPFLLIAVAAKWWMRRKVTLSEMRAEGRGNRARFLFGMWRQEDHE